MITCKLSGGIGNQMFQIAATMAYAWDQNTDPIFDFNSSTCDNQGNVASSYKDGLYRMLLSGDTSTCTNIYKEPQFSYQDIPVMENLCLDGYFQSPRYFDRYKDQIRNLFSFNSLMLDRVQEFLLSLGTDHTTVVHVRRGDYLKFPDVYELCSIDYYTEAMSKFPDTNFVFCAIPEDMVWVKEHFQGTNIYYSPFEDEVEDLLLMILANNVIMANSSFSWWGAYLNPHPDKVVVAPKKWFKKLSSQDIYCDAWQLI